MLKTFLFSMLEKDLLENRIDEFLQFHKEIEEKFSMKLANKMEIETAQGIKQIISEANEECTLPEQIRLNKQLATLLITLGSLASERIKQANVAFRYVRWRKHSEWTPVKEVLIKRLEKLLVGDIEEEVAKRTFAEEMIESNLQGLADWLTTLHRDANGFKSALQRQIDYNIRDYASAQHTAE